MNELISTRLSALRALMAQKGIAATIIPQTDPHQSEYIADHWQLRRHLSGFTGSAGSLVVTPTEAMLWTDSRYFLQAAKQLQGSGIILMKDGLDTTPSIEAWLKANLPAGSTVGIDGMLFSVEKATALGAFLAEAGLKLDTAFDPAEGDVWPDRPALPKDAIFAHDEKYAGQSAKAKLQAIREKAAEQGAAGTLISPLDEIAWTLNIRSRDVKYNPVATAYLFVGPDSATLLTDTDKVDDAMLAYLASQDVPVVMHYDDIKDFISALPKSMKVLVDKNRTSATVVKLLGSRSIFGDNGVAMAKGIKNETQIAGVRDAMVRDGVALVRVVMDIEKAIAQGDAISELDVDALLRKHRSEQDLFFDESFGSIVGWASNGAIVHYEPTPESFAQIGPRGLLLIDSGAQYLDGTTDITRTIAIGEPTEMEKTDFTLVLKGHIALATAVFPVGTRGDQLDVLARQFLWQHGLSYLHGTGHGVGHFLNVHEGPQSVRLNHVNVPLVPGMITSNEPGIYREGLHGVRSENLVLTVPAMDTEFGKFLKFETLTLFPFDVRLIDFSLITPDELKWLKDYHQMVYDKLAPHLSDSERQWLIQKTKM